MDLAPPLQPVMAMVQRWVIALALLLGLGLFARCMDRQLEAQEVPTDRSSTPLDAGGNVTHLDRRPKEA